MYKKLFLILIFMVISIRIAIPKATNGEWVKVSGKVTKATGDYFMLDKGKKSVLVEMDDWDWYKEGHKVLKGDNVIVHGRIDHDFLEQRKIEAESVFVKSLNTYFFASSDDEEREPYINSYYLNISDMPQSLTMEISGIVEKIRGRDLILNTGLRKVKVDTSTLPYNPLDENGIFKVSRGDHVKVSGEIENNWFSDNELNANWLIVLKDKQQIEKNKNYFEKRKGSK